MARIERFRKAWRRLRRGGTSAVRAKLALTFLAAIGALVGLFSAYWVIGIEPRLEADARANASAIAQAQTHQLAAAIATPGDAGAPRRLSDAIDEILLLTEPNTGSPFVLGIETRFDYDVAVAPAPTLDLKRGDIECSGCFVTTVPVFSPHTGELLGVVTFHSSSVFFERLQNDMRYKLFLGSAMVLGVLALAWWAIHMLFIQVKTSEEAAEAATRAKSEFLATMSHEIRTPMNGVLGMVNLLQRTPLNHVQSDYVNTIAGSGEALLRLLDDILDMSRIEAGKLNLQNTAFDIYRLVSELVQFMQPKADEKGVRLSARIADAVPQYLHGDPNRLRQVLNNLIGNAIKFTDEGAITVSVEAHKGTHSAWLEFAVTDTGSGIEYERQRALFEPFTQGDSSISRRYGGTGLGLAICKRLVEAMDGVIGVSSNPGSGSTFYFRLPLRPAPADAIDRLERKVSARRKPALSRRISVLVAEDGLINRRIVTQLLRHEGHEVVEAGNGAEAVEAAGERLFDAILMDLHMPEMDGLQATRTIRQFADPDKARVPIIALTANLMREERGACQAAGMDGFIAKPFRPEKLYEELARVTVTEA